MNNTHNNYKTIVKLLSEKVITGKEAELYISLLELDFDLQATFEKVGKDGYSEITFIKKSSFNLV